MLPLILEQTDRWYYFAVPLGGLIIAPFVIFTTMDIFRRGFRAKPLLAALVGVILPTWFIFSNVGWQFRVDREGVELRAPLNPFEGAGRIAWRDLRSMQFVSKATKGGSTKMLAFEATDTTLELGALPGVPKSFWPLLIEAVQVNAPQAQLGGAATPERWLTLAGEDSQKSWGVLVARDYVMLDGSGRGPR
ncbi:MAG: hypothetical protein WCP68_09345 [Enhydrobacter sp.]